jgi:hypothetical protein
LSERSQPWDSTGVGDGPGTGYTEAQTEEFFRDLLTGDTYAADGVLPGVLNELVASGSSSPVSVASGAAVAYGKYYQNTAATTVAVSSPVVGTTGLRVNLRVDWSAQTVRAVVVKNTDGTSGIPALTQVALTTWEIPLATGTITTGGAISLTDARSFVRMPTALLYRRQGGSATDWSSAGTTNYTPGEVIRQAGVVNVSFASGTGTQAVTFPVAFSQIPIITGLVVNNAASSTKRKLNATIESLSASTLTIRVYLTDGSTSSSSADVHWSAEGSL